MTTVVVFPCLVEEQTRKNFENETAEYDKAEDNWKKELTVSQTSTL